MIVFSSSYTNSAYLGLEVVKKSCQLRFKPRLTKTSFLQRFFFATKTWNMLSGSFLHSSQSNFMAILTHASQMCVHEFRTSVLLFLMQLQKS